MRVRDPHLIGWIKSGDESMGSVKSIAIRNLGDQLIREHGKKFSNDFEKNKIVLNEVKLIKSNKIRNILAGYITKKMRQIEKTGI